ncbi:MAG TPA: hypothetical protein VMT52_15360 [Planctomycetota bacterium]|nr:hypothetical protein [Planctomycetota bacterium]
MSQVRYDCDCDRVIEMEDMAIGVEEILQYARAVLPRDSVRSLIRGLEEILSIHTALGEEAASSQ